MTKLERLAKLRRLLAELYHLGVEGNEWNNKQETDAKIAEIEELFLENS
jgi:hypothetical protein